MFKNLASLTIACTLCAGPIFANPVEAKSQNWTVKTKYGDEVSVKDGWFGSSKKVVKSNKLGTLYENKNGLLGAESSVNLPGASVTKKKGLFGSKKQEVNVLGNTVESKKGLFGSKSTEVKTMFGDSVKTKKGWFGRTKTEVEPGGLTSLLGSMVGLSVSQN